MNIAIRRFALIAGMLVAGASFAATQATPTAAAPKQRATVLARAADTGMTKPEAKKCHDAAGKEVKCPKKKIG